MRVLALNYEFPPLGGGAGNATAHICWELVRLGCTVEVLTTRYGETPAREERDGYVVHRVRALRRRTDRSSPVEMASFTAAAALPAVALARRFRPDILHVYFGMPTGPLGRLVKLVTGTPYLLSLRGGDVPGFLPGLLGKFHRALAPLNRWVWNGASAIVANSEGLRDLAEKQMGLPVALAPNGVDLETYAPRRGTSTHPTLNVLFAGRLVEEQKGVRFLLRALAELGVPADLEVVGAGPDERQLRDLAADLGLNGQVRFPGWVPREQMPGRYAAADVFVFPSFEEGMPNVVLEAMASGLPIIATDIYAHRGLVEDGRNGFLVPVGDAQAIREALVKLTQDPGLREMMGRASRAKAEEYSWERTARTYLELSHKAIEARR